jgi:hypothetical protein
LGVAAKSGLRLNHKERKKHKGFIFVFSELFVVFNWIVPSGNPGNASRALWDFAAQAPR